MVDFRLGLYEEEVDAELSKYREDVGEEGGNVVLIDVVRIWKKCFQFRNLFQCVLSFTVFYLVGLKLFQIWKGIFSKILT